MWSPIDIFFMAWFCNFSPCQNSRLNVSEVIKAKEDRMIKESVGLRDGI